MYQIDDQEIEAISRVLRSRKLYRHQKNGTGECELFEREFAEFIGVTHATLVTSGTNALIAALSSLGVGHGDEVIIPAYTFVATAAAVRLVGARPIVAQVDHNLGLCPRHCRELITSKTKALLPVHMDGLAADLKALTALAQEKKLFLIEDVAQAIGGSFDNRFLGSWGDAAAFSLNENKHISCGEGGIVVTSSRETYLRQFLMQDLASRYSPQKKEELPFPENFLGHSMRVSEIQGALMRVQLARLQNILSGLRPRKSLLTQAIREVGEVKVITGADPKGDCGSSFHLRFANPIITLEAYRRLNEANLSFYPPTLRPAHVAWKWLPDIDPIAAATQRQDLAPSVQNLACVLKLDVDLDLSLEDTQEKGTLLQKVLKEVLCT